MEEEQPKKKKRPLLKIFIAILIVFILIFSSVFYYIQVLWNNVNHDNEFNKADLGYNSVIDKNIYNIALFGVDTRELDSFSGHSDTIMILSVNKKEKTAKLISIMRDSLVPIKENNKTKYNKINYAYYSGGPELAVKTLNSVFGLDISDYATVNFYGLADIIDAVGGLDIELTRSEVTAELGINAMIKEQCLYLNKNFNDEKITKWGVQHLNGIGATAYSRIRYAKNANGNTNDYGRTERQRLVLQKLLDKILNLSITEYPALIEKILPYIKTSISQSEIISLASVFATNPELQQERVPNDKYIINEGYIVKNIGSTVYYNYEFAGKTIRNFIYDDMSVEDYINQNGVDKTRWYKSFN